MLTLRALETNHIVYYYITADFLRKCRGCGSQILFFTLNGKIDPPTIIKNGLKNRMQKIKKLLAFS